MIWGLLMRTKTEKGSIESVSASQPIERVCHMWCIDRVCPMVH